VARDVEPEAFTRDVLCRVLSALAAHKAEAKVVVPGNGCTAAFGLHTRLGTLLSVIGFSPDPQGQGTEAAYTIGFWEDDDLWWDRVFRRGRVRHALSMRDVSDAVAAVLAADEAITRVGEQGNAAQQRVAADEAREG
jgi:hypothetical protein